LAIFSDIGEAAIAVLKTPEASAKATIAQEVAALWHKGHLASSTQTPPRRPARPPKPILLQPRDMPKRRKAGTQKNRIALLHAIAHIELNAIDLAFDMIARFTKELPEHQHHEFISDWISVGKDEAKHFTMVESRLQSLGSFYGALGAHDGLWQAAEKTAENFAARLAVVPMVLEARGLDVTPSMIDQLKRHGDNQSAHILHIIYMDEISHVAKGTKWFRYLVKMDKKQEVSYFQELIAEYFKGAPKPPFNEEARQKAGMPISYYQIFQ
jgi:uncharacterized ferritin-like protein (DUF455 family)